MKGKPASPYPNSGSDEEESDEVNSPVTPGKSGKKRANHNELERKRRQVQKGRLMELRDIIPQLRAVERPSTVLILTKAKEFIDELQTRYAEQERELNMLLQASGGNPITTTSVPLANAISTSTTPTTTTAANANTTTPPTKKGKAVKSEAAGGAAATPTQPSPNEKQVLKELDKLRQENLELKHKLETIEKRQQEHRLQPALSIVPPIDPPPPPGVNFRKRKSTADNDFEAAKLAYYSNRRNSTVEQMQTDSQRLNEGVDLLNFAVEARRASLPTSSLFYYEPPILETSEND